MMILSKVWVCPPDVFNLPVDVSTTDKAKGILKTPFTQNAAAADQEVLIKGDIPPEAIIKYKK